MNFPITIQLEYPIAVGSETISEVSIARRIQGGDMRKIDGLGENARSLTLIGILTGLSPAIVDKIDFKDIKKISEVVESFL